MSQIIQNADLSLVVTDRPHVRAKSSTSSIMRNVVLALAPVALYVSFRAGILGLVALFVAIVSCVYFELAYRRLTKKTVSIHDYSAVITGILLALSLPAGISMWLVIFGAFFAIVVVKQLFGGLGQNFLNPALAARAFLMISYPEQMAGYVAFDWIAIILIAAGGLYLLIRRIIQWHITVMFIASNSLLLFVFGGNDLFMVLLQREVFVGAVMLGAFFMATDYVTSPMSRWGQVIFGIGCGAITAILKIVSDSPEGVTYAILLMNFLVPLIDKAVKPRKCGTAKLSKPEQEEKKHNE